MTIVNGVLGGMVVLFVGMTFVACDSPDNAAACQDYIDKVNTLECYKGAAFTFDCSIYDSTSCDIADYFDCLTENTKCNAMGQPDQSGTPSCASKATCS